ncbi:MAG: alpha/beta hydrolase [Candidatus Pristimantibacillus lignocellulolyticus]|uniref:Alpha/beta hydrolase n=1 Tax=Candidatus Pristimantibacillus lignocellulolyticus TaxID=2994561 RepID=A0A9J6ZLN8_9BACL|nr:MAG: alpha/beta hydrolase [Candidatus Pristimantibacillus lignocellulolyticus]
MNKPLKIILISLAVIIITVVVFLATVFIVNVISSKSEQGKIQAYGQLVPVDGKNMNVLIEGNGEETVVLLTGYGTAAPALDFKPLIEELTPFYKVVVVEPFGYGLSDETTKERTNENIASEIHEALQSLNIDKYILMGHSIAGIYGLEYVNKYEDEVSAFIGIDSSVPTQPGMDVELPVDTFQLLQKSGIARLIMKLSDDPYATLPFDNETKEQLRMITHKNLYTSTLMNEMKNFNRNFQAAESLSFPKTLPLMLFVQANNSDVEGWIPLHEEQVKDSEFGEMVLLEGDHYLHHSKSKEIVESLRAFMEGIE